MPCASVQGERALCHCGLQGGVRGSRGVVQTVSATAGSWPVPGGSRDEDGDWTDLKRSVP